MARRHLRAAPAHPDHRRAASSPGGGLHPGHCRARYQATLDAGGDPQTIAGWTRQVKAERAAALARDAAQARCHSVSRLTEDDIRALITTLGSLRDVIRGAEPAEKAAIYDQLDLKVTLKLAEAKSGPKSQSARKNM